MSTVQPTSDHPECIDCSHTFDPDTSPQPDRCWSCAELADRLAGVDVILSRIEHTAARIERGVTR